MKICTSIYIIYIYKNPISATNTSGLKYIKPNIGCDLFLYVMSLSFLLFHYQLRKLIREQNARHTLYVLVIQDYKPWSMLTPTQQLTAN